AFGIGSQQVGLMPHQLAGDWRAAAIFWVALVEPPPLALVGVARHGVFVHDFQKGTVATTSAGGEVGTGRHNVRIDHCSLDPWPRPRAGGEEKPPARESEKRNA